MPTVYQSEPELTQYRAVSFWAVATLLAGLAAPLALLGPLLWWVPLVTVPLAVLAFRQLAQADLRYVGKTAAVCGLCLAALFFAWSVTQRLSREVRASTEAQQFADEWLQLVLDNQLHAAHQIQTPAARRFEPGMDLASIYESQVDAKRDFESFRGGEGIAALAGQKGKIELQFAEVARHTVDGTTDYFTLRYEIASGSVPGGSVPGGSGNVWITAQRDRRSDAAESDWQITSLSLTEPGSS